jgi:hypothetical protein
VRHAFPAAVLIAAAAMLITVSGQPSIWNGMRPASCLPDQCFCEIAHDQLVRQPANALSGLSFVGVGLFALTRLRRRYIRALSKPDPRAPIEFLLPMAALVLGAGTVFYHASLTFAGQTVDLFGMYLLVTMVALSIVSRTWRIPPWAIVTLGLAINVVLLVLLIEAPEYRRIVFAGLVILAVALERSVGGRAGRPDRRVFWLAAAILGGGFVIWVLDYARIACSPLSWVQGHAVWHLCGAAAVWLTLRYYTGDTRPDHRPA